MTRTIAYLRVSTASEDNEKNKTDILAFAMDPGLKKVEFQEENVSGTKSWTDRLIADILSNLVEGNVIIVSELSRLGRSMLEIMQIISVAIKKGIRMYAIKGNSKLDDLIQSKILAMVFSMAAEIERDLIVKRTKESLASAKANDVKLGRPKGAGKSKLDPFAPEIHAFLANGSTLRFIAKLYKATEATLSHWLRKSSQTL